MRNTFNLNSGILVLSLLVVLFSSCKSTKEEDYVLKINGGVAALFDSFTYKGNDSFYNENSLQDASFFYNPILPGWYSDPSVCTNGEEYFLVTSSFSYFPGVPLFHSKDLVNWTQVGHVLNRESQLENMEGQNISGGIFAPAIEYNPHNQTYYMITTNVGRGNFFVKTTNPFGEWSDPIMLPEVGGIDPSFFFDEDGKAYIVNNDGPVGMPEYDGHRTIMIQEFDVKFDKTIGPRKVIVDKGSRPEDKPIWIEGPHLYKINGKYLLMAAEGGTGGWHSEVIFSSEKPMGNYVAWDKNPILTQRHLNPGRPNPITSAGHADIIQTKEGDWWAFFLACRPIDNTFENLGRETFMMPVKWSEDGFPYITEGDDLVQMICKRDHVTRGENMTSGNFEVCDEFDKTMLNKEWMTLRSSAKDLYSLTLQPGYLALQCSPIDVSEKRTPAYIGRRIQHHNFECSTRMSFNPSQEKEQAGMLLFKDEEHSYFFWKGIMNGEDVVALSKKDGKSNTILASSEIGASVNEIDLKVTSNGLYYNFYYALKPNKWKLFCKHIDASHLSTTKAGGFTGTTIGMYANINQ